jgi:hypothetical protein
MFASEFDVSFESIFQPADQLFALENQPFRREDHRSALHRLDLQHVRPVLDRLGADPAGPTAYVPAPTDPGASGRGRQPAEPAGRAGSVP